MAIPSDTFGKNAGGLPLDEQGGEVVYLDAGSGGTLTLPDAALMFRGAYGRSGPDLSITGPNGEKLVVVDYFGHEHPPTLMSPDGAMLAADLVAQLAGPRFQGQYAQQGPAAQAAPIGQVETVAGSVTITHADGSRTSAADGTPVFERDVVETTADGRISITFADKTSVSLGESARIVLDKFVYDPGGSQNSMLFNLVQGAFVFVAGLVAPSGDMKIQTPVATMGIRGTTGIVRADVQDGTSYFTLKPDPPGKLGGAGGDVGAFDVFARLNGVLIKEVRVPDQLLIVRNAAGQFQDLPQIGSNENAFQQDILNFAFASHQQMLLRLDQGQSPVDGQQNPGNPQNPNNRGDIGDPTKHAGLTPGTEKNAFFRDPLSVDLVKQTDPLGNEEGNRHTQNGDAPTTDNTTPSQTGLVLAPPPSFTTAPLALAFYQEPASPGIHAVLPFAYTGSPGLPATIQSAVTTVTAVSFPVGDAPAQPFTLTPAQVTALANAFNPVTGQFDLAIDTTFLAPGQQVVITVSVTIADSRGLTATQVEAFSIVGTNDAPVLDPTTIHIADGAGVDTFTPVNGNLEAQDPDNGSHVTYALTGDTNGAGHIDTGYGILTLTPSGHYTFAPNSAAINALPAGAHVSIPVGITLSDGSAESHSTIDIVIDGANDTPVITAGQGSVGPYTFGGSGAAPSDATAALYPGFPEASPAAIWQPVDLSQNAHWNVKLYFGPGGGFYEANSGDGITFAFQNTGPTAIGGGGGGLGILGGVPDAVGVKFDTYPFNPGDPNTSYYDNFAQFFANGQIGGSTYPDQQILPLLTDGQFHDVSISWNAATHTLTYTIDGSYTGSIVRDIVTEDFAGNSLVYGGFTGSGGGAYALEQIRFGTVSNGTSGLIYEIPNTAGSTALRTVSGSFIFSDAEVGDAHTISVQPPPGVTLGTFQATLVTDANGQGTVNWTYTVQDAALDPIQNGQAVTETFKILVGDGLGAASQDVNITLAGATEPNWEAEGTAVPVISVPDAGLSQAVVGSSNDEIIELTLPANGTLHTQIDGSGGSNALRLLGSYDTVDLTALAQGQLQNIQAIDLTQGTAQTLTLSIADVLHINNAADAALIAAASANNITISNTHALVIDGDHGNNPQSAFDTLSIVDPTAGPAQGTWVYAGTIPSLGTLSAGSGDHDVYNFVSVSTNEVLASVAVHHDMQVTLPQHSI